MEHKIVALLPMKANSERVKGKNFRDFNGKPLYRWILDRLLKVEQIDQVVINTDAPAILQKSGLIENSRILIRDRKPAICGDMVSMNLIIADDIENVVADTFLMTHTTNPLLSIKTIQRALTAYQKATSNGTADSLFSVNKIQTYIYLLGIASI